ncbi:MAG: phosphoenolpyruvate synthase [Trueperaceae bacterium]
MTRDFVRWFEDLSVQDVPLVGGKNASLGEMIARLGDRGVRVPGGFATTSEAYWRFVDANDLRDVVRDAVAELDAGRVALHETGERIRWAFLHAEMPADLADAIRTAYRAMSERGGRSDVDVAVRSSATAEDLPTASFAGQQETFLNVVGERNLLDACRRCYASLFTDRAISYRTSQGFDHLEVALSIGVQAMVRSDLASSGTMFTLDTETGFPHLVVIDAAWGLGETVVQGMVTPDAYAVHKPLLAQPDVVPIVSIEVGSKERKMVYTRGGTAPTRLMDTSLQEREAQVLSEEEILTLARWAVIIEEHYGRPMDIEWAKDGRTNELFIVQARPETVQSRQTGAIKRYRLHARGEPLVTGIAIGDAVVSGKVQVIERADQIGRFEDGAILVTGMTDPDWVPIMKRASAIVTDHGGRTCHAAIVSRELGIPALAGTGDATRVLQDGQSVTLSCAEGDRGFVYDGELPFDVEEVDVSDLPETRTQVMLNVGDPAAALRWWRLPARGVGLARMEFIVNTAIQVHPMALVRYDQLTDRDAKRTIAKLTHGYQDKTRYFVDKLARGIARIAAAHHPEPVIVRMSDFKTNEYADLIGGAAFEPKEANPMLGFRGASRYVNDRYREGFALECQAIREVRERMGLSNVIVMIPFCRTLSEADAVLAEMAKHGLERGKDGLEVYVMAEIPSNVLLATEFAAKFDGFSIGSNDLTQLLLGVDRDSGILSELFDERNEAVKRSIASLIRDAHAAHVKVGICGQAPSDFPEFAEFLVEAGIDSISLNPDSVIEVLHRIAAAEARQDAAGEPRGTAPA